MAVLKYLKDQGVNRTKSYYARLSEKEEEVIETLHDLRKADVDVVTIAVLTAFKNT